MSLSNSVLTWLESPTVETGAVTEIPIPNEMLDADLKIADLGVYSGSVNGRETGLYYMSRAGVLCSIKKLGLYSGGQPIEEIDDFTTYCAVMNVLQSNSQAEDLDRFDLMNGTDLRVNETGFFTYMPLNVDYLQRYTAQTSLLGEARFHNQIQIAGTSTGRGGIISLKRYFGSLRSWDVLPMIPKLVLRITWNTKAANFINDSNAPSAPGAPTYTPLSPILIAEQRLDAVPTNNAVMPYDRIIVERHYITSAAAGTAVSQTLRSQNFRQRMLKNLMLVNVPSGNNYWLRAAEISQSQTNEIIQLVVNGSTFLPNKGINNEAFKQKLFVDTYGSLNVPLACALPCSLAGEVFSRRDGSKVNTASNVAETTLSLGGIPINKVIDSMEIQYQRTGATNTDLENANQSNSFTLTTFGTTAGLLELVNGSVRISY